MPSGVLDKDDIEHSLTYASYERNSETTLLLPDKTSRKIQSDSILSQEIIEESDQNGTKKLVSRSRGAVVFVACLYMNVSCLGMVAALGDVYVELISAFNCLRAEAALVQSLYMGLCLGGGVFFSMVVTKYDTGACVIGASTIAGLAIACSSFASNIGTVIALVGIVSGIFASVNVLSSSIIVNWTFVNNRKFALSILTLGASIGQTVMPFIADALIKQYSWSGCFVILGALAYFNCIPCGLILHYSKKYFHNGGESNNRINDKSLMSFLTDGAYMLFIITTFIFVLFGPVELWFVVDVADLKGFGAQAGATLLSINGIFGFVGRLITSVILKIYPNTRPELHICFGFILWAIAHYSVVASPVYWGMALAMVLCGYSASIVIAFLPSLQIELRGAEQFSKSVTITFLIMGIGDIIGGYIGGYSVDVTGSYNLIFYIATACTICCAFSMVVIFVIIRRRKGQHK